MHLAKSVDLAHRRVCSEGAHYFETQSNSVLLTRPRKSLDFYLSPLHKKHRNHVQRLVHKAHDSYVCNISGQSLAEGDPKRFHSYLRTKRTENLTIPVLHTGDEYHVNNAAKAEALSDQFKAAFTREDTSNTPDMGPSPFKEIGNIYFTQPGIQKLLEKLKPGKASGPDELPARVLKETAPCISGILSFLFHQSYESGCTPSDWTKATVTAIYKKGSKMDPANYRPVSLTCILCKTMEHIVCSHISKHLDSSNILSFRQHGFRQGFSCETQLVASIDDWAQNLQSRSQTDVALLDFSKAFDCVPHGRLMVKLKHYGISGKTAAWVLSFLSGRSQEVVVNGSHSVSQPVLSGVPQGSVLGPLLFLVFINDITENLNCEIRLFADDSVLYRKINNQSDHLLLQNDLITLQQWAERWQMSFNVSKCAIMTITKKLKPSFFDYVMKKQIIPRVSSHDYLGVRISSDLTWTAHCKKVATKASQTLGMLRRSLGPCPASVKKVAYTCLVRPRLEYASSAWSPHTEVDKKRVEGVQNAAARFCTSNYSSYSSVSNMVSEMGWDSLKCRRLLQDITLLFKIQNALVKIPFPEQVIPTLSRSTRSNHNQKKQIILATINPYKFSFFVRTIPIWNALPCGAVSCSTVAAFQAAALPTIRHI